MPVSNLHKETVTNVKLEEIEVFETCEHEQLSIFLKEAFKVDVTNVIVFFSPSGVRSALPHIPLNLTTKFQVGRNFSQSRNCMYLKYPSNLFFVMFCSVYCYWAYNS